MIVLPWLEFLIDLPSLDAWLKSTFGNAYHSIRGSSTLAIRMTDIASVEQIEAVKAHLATLTSDGEAAKRALKSRLLAKPRADFEAAVKEYIAVKNLADLTVAERKFFMGAKLTNDEYDTLTAS